MCQAVFVKMKVGLTWSVAPFILPRVGAGCCGHTGVVPLLVAVAQVVDTDIVMGFPVWAVHETHCGPDAESNAKDGR